MKYCIITETKEVYKVERIFMGVKKELVFAEIEEDVKYAQLELAAYLRFIDKFITNPHNDNQVFNLTNHNQWLKLIPVSNDSNPLDVPSLSLMA